MSSEKEQESQLKNVNIPIDWQIPDNVSSQYASNVFVQSGEYEIVMSFFQTHIPLLTGTPEENIAKLEQLGTIPAMCVGRIIVNPDLVPKIIKALQKGLDTYHLQKKLSEEGQGE